MHVCLSPFFLVFKLSKYAFNLFVCIKPIFVDFSCVKSFHRATHLLHIFPKTYNVVSWESDIVFESEKKILVRKHIPIYRLIINYYKVNKRRHRWMERENNAKIMLKKFRLFDKYAFGCFVVCDFSPLFSVNTIYNIKLFFSMVLDASRRVTITHIVYTRTGLLNLNISLTNFFFSLRVPLFMHFVSWAR